MKTLIIAAAAGLALPAAAAGQAHVMLEPDEIEWRAGPPSLPEGSEVALLHGNPSEEGVFVMRLRLPDGYAIPPHTHPGTEIVTVVSGEFHLGMGEVADRDAAQALGPGSFFAFDPGMAHYAFAQGETVVQLSAAGPWGIDYINPEDDPRR
jgi:quercetin dioxygenase-like cupin family protein